MLPVRYCASHTKTMSPRGSSYQDPAGNWTTRRPPDHRKETQTAVVWSCLPFIKSGQNHLARHSERGKKTRQTEEEAGKQHQGMYRPGVRRVVKVPEGSGEQRRMVEVAPETLRVKGIGEEGKLDQPEVGVDEEPMSPRLGLGFSWSRSVMARYHSPEREAVR